MKESFIKEEKNKEIQTKTSEEKKVYKVEKEKDKKEEKKKFDKPKESKKEIEKEMEKMDNGTNKKKYIKRIIIISIIALIIIIFSTIFALLNINNEKIVSGVSISGIAVSGLDAEEAKAKLNMIYNEKKQKDIEIKYKEYESTLSPTIMEVDYSIDKAVEEAYCVGRKGNIFLNNYDILFSLIRKKNIPVEIKLNEEVTNQTLNDISVNLPGVVVESSYAIEDDKLIITKGKPGIIVETDKLLSLVKEELGNIEQKENIIEIPVINKEPEKIDIDKIHDEIYKQVQDAYYTKDPFTVYPEVKGIDFDVEAARKLLEEEKDEYIIQLIITNPKVTLDKIGSEAFPEQLSNFKTRYDVSNIGRSINLKLACQKINGKVVLPGEVFSYNKTLGPRTVATGYKNAKVYESGQVVDGIGGGICQISSTLYNAVLKANLEIVERRNHQFVTSYIGEGRDATVVYGMTDFKFKNTRKYPIQIKASVQNGIADISIYGIKEENEYTFDFYTKVIEYLPFATQYIEDGSLPVGTEKVKQKGARGVKTETYITKRLNGKVISTKLLSRDTYTPMNKIIIKGTNGAIQPQEQPHPTEQPVKPQPVVPEPVDPEPIVPEPETPDPTDSQTEPQE